MSDEVKDSVQVEAPKEEGKSDSIIAPITKLLTHKVSTPVWALAGGGVALVAIALQLKK